MTHELWSEEGERAFAVLRAQPPRAQPSHDVLRANEALRRAGFAPELVRAVLAQAALRARAVAKFGADADRLYFTAAGLEQATRPRVAARRAQRIAAAGTT